jgi:MFS family permease
LFQVGLGMNAAKSGGLIFAFAVGALAAKAAVGRALRTLGYRTVMAVNGVIVCVLYTACGFIRADWPHAAIATLLVTAGFFMSIQFTSYNTIAFEHTEQSRMSDASTFFFTLQQMMLSAGVCTASLALRGSMVASQHAEPQAMDFTIAIAIICAISVTGTLAHLRFPRNAGEALSGRKASEAE